MVHTKNVILSITGMIVLLNSVPAFSMYALIQRSRTAVCTTLQSRISPRIQQSMRYSSERDEAYDTLGIRQNASDQEVKHAYYSKAKQYHSDLNRDKNDEEMKKINLAYEVLSKPDTDDDFSKKSQDYWNQRKKEYEESQKQSYKQWQNKTFHSLKSDMDYQYLEHQFNSWYGFFKSLLDENFKKQCNVWNAVKIIKKKLLDMQKSITSMFTESSYDLFSTASKQIDRLGIFIGLITIAEKTFLADRDLATQISVQIAKEKIFITHILDELMDENLDLPHPMIIKKNGCMELIETTQEYIEYLEKNNKNNDYDSIIENIHLL